MVLFLSSIAKELRLLVRNVHAILVLFVMPLAFVLIMSLALQDKMGGQTPKLAGVVDASNTSSLSQRFVTSLNEQGFLAVNVGESDDALFTVNLTSSFDEVVEGELEQQAAVLVQFSPKLGLREQSLVLAAVREAFARVNAEVLAQGLGFDNEYVDTVMLKSEAVVASYEQRGPQINATQQNIPAWLIFAMFFISLPIATVVLYEQQQSTLLRLRSMGMSVSVWLLAKLAPYFLINIIQFVFLLLIGIYALPLLGGEALSLHAVSFGALLILVLAVSIAALGFASLIACVSKSIEQATILAGTSNILFAAIGGIMVPKFVMPEPLQTMVYFSPMGWGLDAFLGVLALGETLVDIKIELTVLVCFGVGSIAVANQILMRRVSH